MGYEPDAYAAAKDADALLILTEWKEFANLDLPRIHSLLKYPIVIDGRNLYAPEQMVNAGLMYHSIGRTAAMPEHLSPANHKSAAQIHSVLQDPAPSLAASA